jgi:hypothetical protein
MTRWLLLAFLLGCLLGACGVPDYTRTAAMQVIIIDP